MCHDMDALFGYDSHSQFIGGGIAMRGLKANNVGSGKYMR